MHEVTPISVLSSGEEELMKRAGLPVLSLTAVASLAIFVSSGFLGSAASEFSVLRCNSFAYLFILLTSSVWNGTSGYSAEC